MKKNIFLSSLYILLCCFTLTACATREDVASNTVTIRLGDHIIDATRATTEEQQAQGLSGVVWLSDNEGMLFEFSEKSIRNFWMRGMKISIDIIWLDNTKIVGIEKNVPHPSSDDPFLSLPTYASPEPVNKVLEVRAGLSDMLGVKSGDLITIIDKES